MSTKQKKTIQKGSFKRLLKLFFFKNKMLTALMLFSIIISAVATALGPQYLGYATDSIVQDMSNPVSSNIHWDRFFLLGRDIECDFSDPVRIEMAIRMVFHTDHL